MHYHVVYIYRFPEISTRILAKHIDDPVPGERSRGSSLDEKKQAIAIDAPPKPEQWIRFALRNEVCHNHKTQRAINEIIQQLLGLESTAASSEIATGDIISHDGSMKVMDCLATQRTTPAELFWMDLVVNDAAFVYEHQDRYVS